MFLFDSDEITELRSALNLLKSKNIIQKYEYESITQKIDEYSGCYVTKPFPYLETYGRPAYLLILTLKNKVKLNFPEVNNENKDT